MFWFYLVQLIYVLQASDVKIALGHTHSINVFVTAKIRPEVMIRWNERFLPDDFVFRYFDDDQMDDSVKLISSVLSRENLALGVYDAYKRLKPMAYKADLWRACMLWMYSGLYLDHKVLLTENITNWIDLGSDNLVLPQDKQYPKEYQSGIIPEYPIWNGLLYAGKPRHPAWVKIIKHIVSNVQNEFYGTSALQVSGPYAYYDALRGDESMKYANRNVQYWGWWEKPWWERLNQQDNKIMNRQFDAQLYLLSESCVGGCHVVAIIDAELNHREFNSFYQREYVGEKYQHLYERRDVYHNPAEVPIQDVSCLSNLTT